MTMKTKKTKGQTASHRKTSLEPSEKLVDQVLSSYPAKSPVELAVKLVGRMGYDMDAYDRACTRVERFVKNRGTSRMPTHIKDKFVLKRLVAKCLAKRFPEASAGAA